MSGDDLPDNVILQLLQTTSTNDNVNANWRMFMSAVRDADNNLIGVIQFSDRKSDGSASMGYSFRRDIWGKGIATEMTRDFVNLGLKKLGLTRITAATLQDNLGSNRVLQKVGFRKVREQPFGSKIDNVYSIELAFSEAVQYSQPYRSMLSSLKPIRNISVESIDHYGESIPIELRRGSCESATLSRSGALVKVSVPTEGGVRIVYFGSESGTTSKLVLCE